MDDLSKEQQLYDKFVDILLDKLDGEPSPKELEIAMKFIDSQHLKASDKHNKGLSELVKKTTQLPFEDDDESPIRRIK